MITRKQALAFLRSQQLNQKIIKHLLCTEAMMRVLAKKFAPLKEKEWALAGLLHDGDYLPTVPVEEQGIRVSQMLKAKGYEIPSQVAYCMAAHNWSHNGVAPRSKMDWCLFCGDSLTGLIVATALVRPDKSLKSVTVASVLKKFRQKEFARGTRRGDILKCEEKLGLKLEEFIALVLLAMQPIADKLGL